MKAKVWHRDALMAHQPTAGKFSQRAHALAVVTEWDEFRTLDYEKILAAMEQPAFVFDGRNILDLPKMKKLGFRVSGIGK